MDHGVYINGRKQYHFSFISEGYTKSILCNNLIHSSRLIIMDSAVITTH